MERRSSAERFVHSGGNVVTNVESSHGVEISGGSTGGVIEAFGDDTNVSLTFRAKNTGLLTLGNSSNRLNLVGSSINIGGASSIVIAPTSTAGVTIGNSSNPVVIGGSSCEFNSTHVNITSTRVVVSTAMQIGTNPSSVGALRLGYDQAIHGRTSTDGNTVQLLKTSTSDLVYLGDATYGSLVRGSSIALASTHVNCDSSRIEIGPSANPKMRVEDAAIRIGNSSAANAVLVNCSSLAFSPTQSMTLTSTLVNLVSTRVQTNAFSTVGSTTAVAALGNIGGPDGPTATAQYGWLKIFDSSGGGTWVAAWK